jgi:hypothetical protein
MEITLQRLFDNSADELADVSKRLINVHVRIITGHLRAIINSHELTDGLYINIRGYNRFKRVANKNCKSPIENCIALNESRYAFETESEYEERISLMDKFSSVVSIRTMILRMQCHNLGNRSAIEDLEQNYDPLVAELRSAFEVYNRRNDGNLGSDCDLLRYIYNFYYEQNMIPHTFPFWRSVIIFTERIRPFINDIVAKKLTVEQLNRVVQVNDTSAGWGDRMYHTILWKHCLSVILHELEYDSDYINKFRSMHCYIGFDVNVTMEPVYCELADTICQAVGITAKIATVHILDSTSPDAFAIMIKNAYGISMTSSPTPREIYSDCVGDSSTRFCSETTTATGHLQNGKNWVLGFVAGMLSNVCRVLESRVKMGAIHDDKTYFMMMADCIDSYSVTTRENGKIVKTSIPVAEDFFKVLQLMLPKGYKADIINNCYLETEKTPIYKCCGYKKSEPCDKCNNSHSFRSIITANIQSSD